MGELLIILVVFAVVWLLFVMPARRRRASHEAMQDSIELGDEVITAGGIHGTVRELGPEQLRLEIAPEVVVTLDRRAVAAVAREIEVEVEPEVEAGPDETPAEEPREAG